MAAQPSELRDSQDQGITAHSWRSRIPTLTGDLRLYRAGEYVNEGENAGGQVRRYSEGIRKASDTPGVITGSDHLDGEPQPCQGGE
ncbi:hypothetical protein AB0H12_34510 [Actinosynnema sp. NPDC023794]